MLFPLYDLNPHRHFPLMTMLIIAINVTIMAWMGAQHDTTIIYQYGFIPKRVTHSSTGQPIT